MAGHGVGTLLKDSLKGVWVAAKYDAFVWTHRLRAADKIDTDMTGAEKRKLYDLVRARRPRIIVEIGSYLGASALFMAAGARNAVTRKIHCVDTWMNDAMDDERRDTYAAFRLNTAGNPMIEPHRGESTQIAAEFDQPIDLLLIDGDHSPEGVRNDWHAWSPSLADGATVVLHDCGWARGVQELIQTITPQVRDADRLPNLFWATLDRSTPGQPRQS